MPSKSYLQLMEKEDRNVLISAGLSVVTAPVAAGVMAWVWKFPIVMVGNSGGTVDDAISAAFSMLLFMTVFSFFFFIGIVVIGLAGAGVGVLVRRGPVLDAVVAGVAVGVLAALVVGFGGVLFD
ncbi:hypothetical protein [Dietzia maris]|uniref:hypothetical protein n=1 Tax=Dietzia maris TaxID=37915 RepID=UPI00223B74BB|nr:hypothetical protein [Dietzia maris]MCT1434110.1 hypothetical protein [Dietzia maris]MCT1520642.1 hypothetical protein [Dietzia maris]